MDYPIPCTICRESDHRLQKCPELYSVERYSGGGEGGGHSHDDDDEKVTIDAPHPICPTPK
jgi:hypothetical protein